jgi:hypothetical protein
MYVWAEPALLFSNFVERKHNRQEERHSTFASLTQRWLYREIPSIASMHMCITTHIGSSLPDLFTTSWSPSRSGLCQFKITIFPCLQWAHHWLCSCSALPQSQYQLMPKPLQILLTGRAVSVLVQCSLCCSQAPKGSFLKMQHDYVIALHNLMALQHIHKIQVPPRALHQVWQPSVPILSLTSPSLSLSPSHTGLRGS